MAMIFKIGEHSEFPPIPEGFPTCGDYLFPKLPNEKQEKWNNKENEVNFGDDYGISYNVTHEFHKSEDVKKSTPFGLSRFWEPKTAVASVSNVASCNDRHLMPILVSFLVIPYLLNL